LLLSIGLDEWGIRGLQLVTGLAMIPVFVLALRQLVGRDPALLFGLLVATSPLLIFYSRYARPYILSASLGFGALLAFHAWVRQGRTSQFVTYVVAATLCAWFSPPALPAVLAPPGCFLLARLFQRLRAGQSLTGAQNPGAAEDSANAASPLALFILIAVTLAGIAIWLVPPFTTNSRSKQKPPL
jgi:hypothetical protein